MLASSMAFFVTFSVMVFSIMILVCSSSSSLSSSHKGKDRGFIAPLIHRSSPESPLYDPNATPFDLMKNSVRASTARAAYFSWIKNSSYSMKYPLSPVDLIDIDYVMRYSIGTPPVDTFAIPDTASNLIWLQCDCMNCYNQSIPIFNPSKSSSYQSILCGSEECNNTAYTNCDGSDPICTYSVTYQDDSNSRGQIATETLTFQDSFVQHGKYPLTNMLFGCGHSNTDTSGSNIPGVVGLSNHPSSLIGQLDFSEFSYCISSNASKGHSQIRFGRSAMISGRTTCALAPDDEGLYFLKDVDGIYVEGEKIDVPEWIFHYVKGGLGGLIIDSGATYSQLYPLAFEALLKKVKDNLPSTMKPDGDLSGQKWELCYDNKYRRTETLPEIEFRFNGNENTFPLSDQNAWVDNTFGQFCLAIRRGEVDTLSVIGMYQQRDVNVGMDLKLGQVSFMYAFDCPVMR